MSIGMIYATLFGLGVVYALTMAVFGWFADHDFGGLHMDAAGHIDQPHPLSGTVVATFISGFGGGGTLAHFLLDWPLLPGLGAATVTGLMLAGAVFLMLDFIFARTQAGSEFRTSDAVGRVAEVITPIPEGGMGEIAYVIRGQRELSGARAVDRAAIAKGSMVVIERMMGATAYVRPQQDQPEEA